jgi:hypothetical protein
LDWLDRLDWLERLERLERLDRLKRLERDKHSSLFGHLLSEKVKKGSESCCCSGIKRLKINSKHNIPSSLTSLRPYF